MNGRGNVDREEIVQRYPNDVTRRMQRERSHSRSSKLWKGGSAATLWQF